MALPGLMEILVIAGILLILLGVPLTLIGLFIWFSRRSGRPHDDDGRE